MTCGSANCLCVATAEGKGACVLPSTQCGTATCTTSADCGGDKVCAINTCCRKNICIAPKDVCGNTSSASRMFRRKTWDGETIGGGI
jgi:hypothetical protein